MGEREQLTTSQRSTEPLLAPQQPLQANRSRVLQAKPSRINDKTKKPKPDTSNRVAFSVPLTAELRTEIAAKYRQYLKTGTVSLGSLRPKLLRQYLHVMTPTTLEKAEVAASLYNVFIDDDDAGILASLYNWAYLPKPGPTAPKNVEPVSREVIGIEKPLLDTIRAQFGVKLSPPTTTSSPSLTDNSKEVGDALGWIWDLLKGDFNDNPTTGQTLLNAALGLIPGVDQAFDVRDLVANLLKLTWQGRYDEFEPWVGFALSAVGAIPELGSVIKGVGTLVKKGVSKVPFGSLLDALKMAGNLDGALDLGHRCLESVISHSKQGIDSAKWVLEKLIEALGMAKSAASVVSTAMKQRLEKFIGRCGEVLARVDTKLREAYDYLATQFRALVEKLEEKLGRKTEKATVEVGEETLKLRAAFLKEFPSGVAPAWRGVRLPKGKQLMGTMGGEGTMVILPKGGGMDGALHYALNPTKNKFTTSDTDTIWVIELQLGPDHIIAYPEMLDFHHIMVAPSIDLAKLVGYKATPYTVEAATKLAR